jgi:3-hydroxyisobutyrate dehydrogenase
MNIFADTSGGPNVLKVRGPSIAAALNGAIGASDFRCRFDTQRPANDDRRSAGLGGTLPVTARALECIDQASRDGLGKSDAAVLPVRWSAAAKR